MVALGLAACGVEVPDEVASRATSTTTTTEGGTPTTEAPTSDDELEQALLDNGYTLDEARCGADNLRAEVDDDEIDEIIEADTIEDIDPAMAADFASALQDCVQDGATDGDDDSERPDDDGDVEGDEDDDGPRDPDAPDDPDRPRDPDPPDGGADMPDFGDDSEGDVSRSRFLSALIVSGVSDTEARCIVDAVYSELEQDDINDLFHAASTEEIPPDVVTVFEGIIDECR